MRLGNCKLKNSVIANLIKIQQTSNSKLTSTDIDLVMYIVRYQNSLGMCRAFHSKVCTELEISKQSFYNSLNNLTNLGVIETRQQNNGWWSLRLVTNEFVSEKDYKAYTNINRRMFSGPFMYLKANEKLLMLYLFINPRASMCLTVSNSLAKLCTALGVKEDTLRRYLKRISPYFKIKVKRGIVFATTNEYSVHNNNISERKHYFIKYFDNILTICKVSYALEDIEDLLILVNQYWKRGLSRIIHDLNKTINRFGFVNTRYLNKLLQRA